MEQYSLITIPLLRAAMPRAREQDLEDFVAPLNEACREYGITTPVRQAAFLAEIAVESDHLWRSRDHYKTARGEEYASGAAYEDRKDLGNIHPADGPRYKGRGLIQTTGFSNYEKLCAVFKQDFLGHPELLLDPKWSCYSACFYWKSHGLNELADAGDFIHVTKRINGGTNGEPEREAAWARVKAALAI